MPKEKGALYERAAGTVRRLAEQDIQDTDVYTQALLQYLQAGRVSYEEACALAAAEALNYYRFKI